MNRMNVMRWRSHERCLENYGWMVQAVLKLRRPMHALPMKCALATTRRAHDQPKLIIAVARFPVYFFFFPVCVSFFGCLTAPLVRVLLGLLTGMLAVPLIGLLPMVSAGWVNDRPTNWLRSSAYRLAPPIGLLIGQLWDLESFRMITSTGAESSAIQGVAFSNSGENIVVASTDQLRVWNWEPPHCVNQLDCGWHNVQVSLLRVEGCLGT